jgi:diguanylate cyclase (GGDEF)-like protein/PAS domain S-box-containing protein
LIFTFLLFSFISLIAFYIYHFNRKLKRNIEDLRILNQRELISNHILKLLTTGASLTEALNAVIANVQAHDSSALCSVVLFNEDGTQLRLGTAPALQLSDNDSASQIDISACTCASTLKTGKRSIAINIHRNPLCSDCKEIVAQAGLIACCAEPITSSTGQTIGILTVYHREAHEPSDGDLKLINQLAHLTSVAVEHLKSKQLLQQQHDLLAKISAEVPGIIFQFRMYPNGRCCFPFISEAVRKMYGLKPESLREDATPFFSFRHPEDAALLEESIHESARSLSRWHIEYRLRLPGQGTRWRLGDAMPEKLEDGSIMWHGFITDITERKNAEERIRHMAQYDALTDLPNRALLSDRLQQALASAKREQKNLTLMFIDLDHFKPINDNLGHAVGDKLLKKSALRMQRCLRESDTIARIGGDEFVVLLADAESKNNAKIVAEKIRQAIDLPFEIDGYKLDLTVSIGIAIYPEHGGDEIELSKNADCAMYHAKQSGRNTLQVYHPEMQVIGQ